MEGSKQGWGWQILTQSLSPQGLEGPPLPCQVSASQESPAWDQFPHTELVHVILQGRSKDDEAFSTFYVPGSVLSIFFALIN